jgi:restriction system protein
MGRRGSFINAVIRDAARSQRMYEAQQRRDAAEQRRQIASAIRSQREAARFQLRNEREEKQRYAEQRNDEAELQNEELNEKIREFTGILAHTLSVDDAIAFESLKDYKPFRKFSAPKEIARETIKPLKENFLGKVKPLSFIEKAIPGSSKRHQKAVENAEAEYKAALDVFSKQEGQRLEALEKEKKKYDEEKDAFELQQAEKNLEIDKYEAAYKAGDNEAIINYFTLVLERSEYPEDFPQEFRVAFVPESKQLVVDYELPSPDVIPTAAEYRYVKSKDTIEEKPRKAGEIKDLYQELVASVSLRTCHELFEADKTAYLDTVVFNGFVQTVDVATGKDIRPCLISVRMTRENFNSIDLARVDKKACLRNLGATVSPRPYEVQPVKPIVEFDMVDKRFVEQSDVLTDLESRPNLMELNPFEFENLVSNLFSKMGLDTKQTRSSKDGGVDAVAFDLRPVIGGKVVIQAKRYKNTVGVSAVRDLYGTMMNEGANKGILVTTSGYGPDAFEFAKDKPIELLDGGQLLYLLDQVGVKARIVFPEDWNGN